VLLTLIVAVAAAVRWRRRTPEAPPEHSEDDARVSRPSEDGLRAPWPAAEAVEPQDGSLDEALERVWAEHAHDAETLLDARLHQLVQRGVPVRALRRAPGGRVVRVVFADNTVVLCQGTGTGDFGRLGLAMHRSAVRLAEFVHEETGTRLEFRWNPGQRLAAVAVGLDQPD
jgi:hypothetical protein